MATPFEVMFEAGKQVISRYLGGTEWIVACTISLFISVSIIGLIHLFAAFFQSERLRERGKEEFSEFLLSLTIFGLVAFALALLYAISISISPAHDSYIESAKKFFYDSNTKTGIFYISFRSAYSLITQVSMLSLISTANLDMLKYTADSIAVWGLIALAIGLPLPAALPALKVFFNTLSTIVDVSFSPFASLNPLVDPLEDLFSVAIINSYVAYALHTLVDFLNFLSLRTLLPLGLLLRAFPLTRKTGSTLIAISLVGIVFYPLSINLTQVIYNEVAKNYKIDLVVFYPEDSGGNIILDSPSEFTNIKGNQPIIWDVSSPNTPVWRIWKKVKCNDDEFKASKNVWNCSCNIYIANAKGFSYRMDESGRVHKIQRQVEDKVIKQDCNCNGHITENELPPPQSSYDGYKLTIQAKSKSESCYTFITSGTGNIIEFYPTSFIKENGTYTFLVDAYDYDGSTYNPIGREENIFLIGDVCKGLRYAECIGGEISKSIEETGMIGLDVGESVMSGIANTLDDLGLRGNLILAGAAAPLGGAIPLAIFYTPYVAGEAYINLSSILIPVLLPIFANVLGIVISLIISITGFRTVSTAIGGESRILGLAKLV